MILVLCFTAAIQLRAAGLFADASLTGGHDVPATLTTKQQEGHNTLNGGRRGRARADRCRGHGAMRGGEESKRDWRMIRSRPHQLHVAAFAPRDD